MGCGGRDKKKKGRQLDLESVDESDNEFDPDALTVTQVILSVGILMAFSLSFATAFFLLGTALNSLKADFDEQTYACEIDHILTQRNISCPGMDEESPCIDVRLRCEGFNETKTMYEYYQDYYINNKDAGKVCWCDLCSADRCLGENSPQRNNDGQLVKYPLQFLMKCCTKNTSMDDIMTYSIGKHEWEIHSTLTFYTANFSYDRNKPEAMFFMKNKPGSNNVVLEKGVAYFTVISPVLVMAAIGLVLLILFMANKLSAKEVYRPLTPITPLHKKIKGKWYIRETTAKPRMNAFERLKNITKQQEVLEQSQKHTEDAHRHSVKRNDGTVTPKY